MSRRALRYPFSARAEIFDPIKQLTVRGTVTVISAVGCFIRAADTLEANAIVLLRIKHNEVFETQAQVVHVVNDGMALAFCDTEQSQKNILTEWIKTLGRT